VSIAYCMSFFLSLCDCFLVCFSIATMITIEFVFLQYERNTLSFALGFVLTEEAESVEILTVIYYRV
jgi:hypothetical protein